jgi:hypothetical protein
MNCCLLPAISYALRFNSKAKQEPSTSQPTVSAANGMRSTHLHHSCRQQPRRHASSHRDALNSHIHQLLLLLLLN